MHLFLKNVLFLLYIVCMLGIIQTAIENLECKIKKLNVRNQAFLASNVDIRDAIHYTNFSHLSSIVYRLLSIVYPKGCING